MVNLNNVLSKSSNFELGESIIDRDQLKSIFEYMDIHYIDLCVPVVQIKYFENNRVYFAEVFDCDVDDLIDLINFNIYIVVNSKKIKRFSEGQILERTLYFKIINELVNDAIEALSGGEAIQYLINKYAKDENKRYLNLLLIDKLSIYYVCPKYPDVNLIEYYDYIIHRN